MANVTVSRKQRLRTLENDIRTDYEAFYHVGMKLKEIRDDELYTEDGFPPGDAGWRAYCKERWEWSKDYSNKLIRSAEYRKALPDTSGIQEWSERSVRELTRLDDKREAARVAAKVVKVVEQSQQKASADPKAKPVKLTAATVRKYVDQELGVDRKARAKATKRRREEESKPELRQFLVDLTGTIEAETEKLATIDADAWKLFRADNPKTIKRLVAACDALADLLRSADG